MNVIQEAIMTKYGLEIGQEFYIAYNKSFDGYKNGEMVNNYKYHFDETGEVVNERGQRKMSILGGLVAERFAVEKVETLRASRLEYDLMKNLVGISRFGDWNLLITLKRKGHFKGIPDTTMKLKDILENCEVVDD